MKRTHSVGLIGGEELGRWYRKSFESEANVPRVAITDDLHIHSLSGDSGEHVLDEVLIHPGLQFAHPIKVYISGALKSEE